MSLSKLVTLREAAEMMGERGPSAARRVRDRLIRHDRSTEILVRIGGRGNGTRYRVSLSALRLHMPQLRDPENDIIPVVREEVSQAVAELDDQITEMRDDFEALGSEVGRRYRDLLERVQRLETWHASAARSGGRQEG